MNEIDVGIDPMAVAFKTANDIAKDPKYVSADLKAIDKFVEENGETLVKLKDVRFDMPNYPDLTDADMVTMVSTEEAEIERFVSKPVEAEELSDSQANFIGRLPLALESNAGVAGALLNLERYNLGLDYYRNYAEQIKAITVEDVLAAAQNYFDPKKLAITIAGP